MDDSSGKKIVIAIDGFSSSGKSTFARELAARLGYLFIDSGAMYRAVTLYAMEHGAIRPDGVDEDKVIALLPEIKIDFKYTPLRKASDIYLNGELAESRIRTPEVGNLVSRISSIPQVRKKLVAIQQALGRGKGVVMDGRDIGTVVFPDAELKIFMTADPAVRARRRYEEHLSKGEQVSLADIERNIGERDHFDQTREVSPLLQAPDAILLDNSQMTLAEQLQWIAPILEERAGN